MNWLIFIGGLFFLAAIVGGLSDISAFLGCLLIAAIFLFWGGRKAGIIHLGIISRTSEKLRFRRIAEDLEKQADQSQKEHQKAIDAPDLTPEELGGIQRSYHYKDVNLVVSWKYSGQYGADCKSIGIRRGDKLEIAPSQEPEHVGEVAVFWKNTLIGHMKRNRMAGMAESWKSAKLPVLVFVSSVGGQENVLAEFAFYGRP